MTHAEFFNRTNVTVSSEEFDAINTVYMASDLDKDAFCKMWCKMNYKRVNDAKVQAIAKAREEARRQTLWGIVNRGYRESEFDMYACEFFNPYEMMICDNCGIEIKWSTRVRDIVFYANQYLYA